MSTTRTTILGFVYGVAITLLVGGMIQTIRNSPSPTNNNDVIRIGIMLPLTGDAAAWGVEPLRAIRMAQEEINNAGGINGAQLEFVVEDDKCDPATAASAAQKLINVDKVKIIFGGSCSGETLAAAPITEEAKVLLISPVSTSPDITEAGDYVFRTIPSDAGQGTVAADYAYHNLHAHRIMVIAEQTDYGQALVKVFTERLKSLGGEVIAQESFQGTDTDLRAQILKIKNLSSLDLVYLVPQSPATGELLMLQLKTQEVTVPLMGSEVLLTRENIRKNPSHYAGLIATEPYFDDTSSLAAAFLAHYEQTYGEKPSIPLAFVASAYSQTYLLKEGIEKVGFDTDTLKAWLYTVKGWVHVLGELTIDEHGDALGLYAIKKVLPEGTLQHIMVVKP